MVFERVRDYFAGAPELPPGPVQLPKYFPLVPIGCEEKADKLFNCIGSTATDKMRELEKSGKDSKYHQNSNNLSQEDDPLEPCREFLAYYNRCCERNLRKRNNERLLEIYRVHEEYRYKSSSQSDSAK
uniref:Uncharacterized protein n=1 Tax=Leptocylindrus danicus TaxID=163516 RepID=A0A7S2PI50_9STRA|mmetsp:Transcript_34211/g.49663  ORF Transcript_34211/g.49663 Transcript_34211/m.49663 type:complete len:128 (+) Transcript_34211:161-544(+)